jgi:hypothetical protein
MLLEYILEDNGNYDYDKFANYWKKKILDGYATCNHFSHGHGIECHENSKPGHLNKGSLLTFLKTK